MRANTSHLFRASYRNGVNLPLGEWEANNLPLGGWESRSGAEKAL